MDLTRKPATFIFYLFIFSISAYLYVKSLVGFSYFYKYMIIDLVHPGSVSIDRILSDEITFWGAGKLFLTKNIDRLYDAVWYYDWRDQLVGQVIPRNLDFVWLYPPQTILVTMITAPFSYIVSFFVWDTVIVVSAIAILIRAGAPRPVVLFGLLSPAALFCIRLGQPSLPLGALFIAALMASVREQRTSGVMLGVIVFKPQTGLLGPIALAASRRFRAIAWSVSVAAILTAGITLIAGPGIWAAYLRDGLPTAQAILMARFPSKYELSGTSIFWMARSFGASISAAWLAQGLGASGAALWCWLAWRRPNADRVALVALTAILSPLVSPYGFGYDTCALAIMTAWMAWRRRRATAIDVLLWMWPFFCWRISLLIRHEVSPVILLLGALQAWRELSLAPAMVGRPAVA